MGALHLQQSSKHHKELVPRAPPAPGGNDQEHKRSKSTKENLHREPHLRSPLPFDQAKMGFFILSKLIKSSAALKTTEQGHGFLHKPLFGWCSWVAGSITPCTSCTRHREVLAIGWQGDSRNFIFHVTVFLFPFCVIFEKLLKCWDLGRGIIIPAPMACPKQQPAHCPRMDDKHTVEVRGTITAHAMATKKK